MTGARGPDPTGEGSSTLIKGPVRLIGTGLIGGSLGLALRRQGIDVHIEDISPGTAALAVDMGVGRIIEAGEGHPQLVLVAAPPDVAGRIVARALDEYPSAVIADVASVKGHVLAEVTTLAAPKNLSRYVGAHPMAGREVTGVMAARADLFGGRPFVITPHAGSDPAAVRTLTSLAVDLGAFPVEMDAALHDEAVAYVSHVPQLVASLLATRLLDAPDRALDLAGQGLRDTTRIAASDPRLWVEILTGNTQALKPVLSGLRDDLNTVLDALEGRGQLRRSIAETIANGNRGVARIPGKHGGRADAFAELTVIVPDRAGKLAGLLADIGDAGINLEDLRLEHSVGQDVGLAHVSVQPSDRTSLERTLTAGGWKIASTEDGDGAR
ncbi:prephenate dehydrogenase [Devriesea agamarum]|uniref:prephenate dehydrogenase n=1 Tax=Devriesea agamarum TaxID=472569 RepID=UPI00071DC818|nr:prephenate dehydrogenase [Devriesea agamarum]